MLPHILIHSTYLFCCPIVFECLTGGCVVYIHVAAEMRLTRGVVHSCLCVCILQDMWSEERHAVAVPLDLLKAIQAVNPTLRGYLQQVSVYVGLKCLFVGLPSSSITRCR